MLQKEVTGKVFRRNPENKSNLKSKIKVVIQDIARGGSDILLTKAKSTSLTVQVSKTSIMCLF